MCEGSVDQLFHVLWCLHGALGVVGEMMGSRVNDVFWGNCKFCGWIMRSGVKLCVLGINDVFWMDCARDFWSEGICAFLRSMACCRGD